MNGLVEPSFGVTRAAVTVPMPLTEISSRSGHPSGLTLPEPFNIDSIREPHHHRPPVEQSGPTSAPPFRIPRMRVPRLFWTNVEKVGDLPWRPPGLLQERHIGAPSPTNSRHGLILVAMFQLTTLIADASFSS